MNPMDWIKDHLQVILAIAGAIAYWLNQRNSTEAEKAAKQEADEGAPRPTSAAEAEAADEARAAQVREEIRRTIAARRRGAEPAMGDHAAPVRREADPFPQPSELVRPPLPMPPARTSTPAPLSRPESWRPTAPPPLTSSESLAASLTRQEQLAEKLRELTEQRAIVERRAKTAAIGDAVETRRKHDNQPINVAADLRDPRSLRRAMLMREVLGAPVSLR
jgi:hypothetical protein